MIYVMLSSRLRYRCEFRSETHISPSLPIIPSPPTQDLKPVFFTGRKLRNSLLRDDGMQFFILVVKWSPKVGQ